MDLNHLHLHVADLEATKLFYETHFGFREHVQRGPILFLRNERDFDLALHPAENEEPLPDWFHFGFRLVYAAAVRALHRRLGETEAERVTPLQVYDDFVAFRCTDPSGNSIEVYWE